MVHLGYLSLAYCIHTTDRFWYPACQLWPSGGGRFGSSSLGQGDRTRSRRNSLTMFAAFLGPGAVMGSLSPMASAG